MSSATADVDEAKLAAMKSGSRKRMRTFLGDLLDSQDVPGLEWVNKERKTFRMPWKHAKKKGYDSGKDTLLIKLWAMNTGRYRKDNPDPTTWKINFRCALNSLRESIVEVETPTDEDCRIFRFEDSRRGRGKSLGALPPDALHAKADGPAAKLGEKRKADDPSGELAYVLGLSNTCDRLALHQSKLKFLCYSEIFLTWCCFFFHYYFFVFFRSEKAHGRELEQSSGELVVSRRSAGKV